MIVYVTVCVCVRVHIQGLVVGIGLWHFGVLGASLQRTFG